MLNAEHNTKLKEIFHKAFYWKAAAFGTLCIQQEYQVYEQLAKGRFWDMSSHLKKTVNRFWRAVSMGYAISDKYLLIVEESFLNPEMHGKSWHFRLCRTFRICFMLCGRRMPRLH